MEIQASLTALVQQAQRSALDDPTAARHRTNYRGDVTVSLPGGRWGANRGKVFVHARLGLGEGVALRPTYTCTANSTTFTGHHPDDIQIALAQAWYQLDMPLGNAGAHKAVVTLGKIDPFGFFDQNAVADDETRGFVNNVFVHNPLLDSGGDLGADRFGFSPGVMAAYENESNPSTPWGVSVGLFGSGNGSNFSSHRGQRFVMAQAWASTQIQSQPGTYRAYVWRNPRGTNFDGSEAAHSGWGLSVDQHVSGALTLFARYGHQTAGRVMFDNALTLGGELGGANWGRENDGLGFAWGLLRTSGHYASASAADTATYGYAARGSEQIAEVYYRLQLNDHVEIIPSIQHIARPAANPGTSGMTVLGLRVRVGF